MIDGARVAVVVPAHDEEQLIAHTVCSVPSWVDHIVVVDDASTDATADRIRRLDDPRVELRVHDRNLGVGAALVTGYRAAFAQGADVAAVMAGDGQMHPDDLSAVLAPLLRGEAEYVKGDRLSHPEVLRHMPRFRWIGNHVLSWLTRRATGLPLRDSQCGYTALSRQGAERLPLHALWPRYGYPNDLLGHAAVAGLRVRDVPVRAVYGAEQSGVRLWHAMVLIPSLIVRIALRRRMGRRALPGEVAGDAHFNK